MGPGLSWAEKLAVVALLVALMAFLGQQFAKEPAEVEEPDVEKPGIEDLGEFATAKEAGKSAAKAAIAPKAAVASKDKNGRAGKGTAQSGEAGRFAAGAARISSNLPQTPADALERLGLEHIYVVRLEGRGRSELLEEDAARLKVPLEFWPASDGHNDKTFKARIVPSLYRNATCTHLIGAVFDSHERAWQSVSNMQKPVLMLEDDIRLPPNFWELWEERKKELPEVFNLVYVGGALRMNAGVLPHSKHVGRLNPETEGWVQSPMLGTWGYFISPNGAKRYLEMIAHERRHGHRQYQPLDLFMAWRSGKLEDVYVFEPPPDMEAYFERTRDGHHVISSHRQIGIVHLNHATESQNVAKKGNAETEEFGGLLKLQVELGESGQHHKGWHRTERSIRKMRSYSCWATSALLRNAALSVLRSLEAGSEEKFFPKGLPRLPGRTTQPQLPLRVLLLAYELLASSLRFVGGTWLEKKNGGEMPQWINHALHMRKQNGFGDINVADALIPGKKHIELPDGHLLSIKKLRLYEPLPE